MMTLLGSLLGFASSAMPDVLKLIRDKRDREHELSILKLQLKQQAQGHTHRIEEINVQADIDQTLALYDHDKSLKGSPWVESLRASVRPILTYAFFIVFAAVKGAGLYTLATYHQMSVAEALPVIWDKETQALFAAVCSFWFGSRSLNKYRGTSP